MATERSPTEWRVRRCAWAAPGEARPIVPKASVRLPAASRGGRHFLDFSVRRNATAVTTGPAAGAVRMMTAMDDYLCITVTSRPGEPKADFAARLSHFWTHMLRTHKLEFEKVYAETTAFGTQGESVTRQYLVEADVV